MTPKLLAWCSWKSNDISMIDLETKQKYAEFKGVQIEGSAFKLFLIVIFYYIDGYWTHVKEISNTGLLVSLNQRYNKCAGLEIFDISQKQQVKKIFSFENVVGGKYYL
jgi:hypothetical protein